MSASRPDCRDSRAPITLGSIKIGGVSPFWVGATGSGVPGDWTPLLPGNDFAFDGKEEFNVVPSAPVYALGFDMVEPSFGGWGGAVAGPPHALTRPSRPRCWTAPADRSTVSRSMRPTTSPRSSA